MVLVGLVISREAAAQVPQISLPLVPSSATPGSVAPAGPGLTITINGTGFVPHSEVFWNGVGHQTNVISSTRLTMQIFAEDVELPGTAWVIVANPVIPGGFPNFPATPTSNIAYFEITNPTTAVSFARADYAVGSAPPAVMVADFNGDGKLDLAVTNISSNSVSILLGKGDGTFGAPVNFATGNNPLRGVVGDFNGDGKPDLAIPNKFSNNVSVLLGNGDGTFQPAVSYAAGNSPVVVALGDFNGDGKLDLAVANLGSGSVSILLGNGDGTFQAAVNYSAGLYPAESVTVGDFNGDGKPDLAVANDSTVSVLLGNGDGTFQPAVNYAAGNLPFFIAVGDFNGDGKPDLAVTNYNGGNVSVLLGNGDGTFQSPANYSTGPNPASVTVGDLNGDGKPDLAVANYNNANVSVLLGNGDGTFQAAVNYAVGGGPSFAAFGDFNGDGRMDLAVSNQNSNNVSILLQQAPASGFAQLNGGNTFTGDQTVNGTVTATNFVGDGSGLSGITVANANTANTANFATSAGSANTANFATTAGDAATLGGNPASAFALASNSPNYVAKAGDTMTGTLNLPANGLVAGGNQLSLFGGNIGIGTATPEAVGGYTSLHVNGNTAGAFLQLSRADSKGRLVYDQNGLLLESTTAAPVRIKAGPVSDAAGGGTDSHLWILTNGNVGIGTNTPGQKLSVAGLVESTSGGFKFPDGTSQATASSGGGTVTTVNTGSGLAGGPITSSGTISIPPGAVTNGMLSNSSVTVSPGAGLTGGGSVALGGTRTLSLANAACGAGQAVTALPLACTPFASLGTNNFLGSQSINSSSVNNALTVSNSNGTGVLTRGLDYGVAAIGAIGMYGTSTSTTGVGVHGSGGSTQTGVQGDSFNGYGVYGITNAAGIAGAFQVTNNGKILSGLNSNTEVFSVTGSGSINTSGTLTTAGSVTIGSGTAITKHLSIQVNPTFAALKPTTCATANFTLTGAVDGDTIALGVANARMLGGGILNYFAWVSAADTITLRACNIDPNNPQKTAGSGVIRIDLWKH